MLNDEMAAPEFLLLNGVLGDEEVALKLAKAPGGWRGLERRELLELGLEERHAVAVRAMQQLVRRSWPDVPREKLLTAEDVVRAYVPRLAAEKDEIVMAVALDGDGYFLQQIEVGRNTGDGFGLQPSSVLRPLIRAGAEAFVVVTNSPSGEPRGTPDLVAFSQRLETAGNAVGVLLRDVLVVGARDHGWLSLEQEGIIAG